MGGELATPEVARHARAYSTSMGACFSYSNLPDSSRSRSRACLRWCSSSHAGHNIGSSTYSLMLRLRKPNTIALC